MIRWDLLIICIEPVVYLLEFCKKTLWSLLPLNTLNYKWLMRILCVLYLIALIYRNSCSLHVNKVEREIWRLLFASGHVQTYLCTIIFILYLSCVKSHYSNSFVALVVFWGQKTLEIVITWDVDSDYDFFFS